MEGCPELSRNAVQHVRVRIVAVLFELEVTVIE